MRRKEIRLHGHPVSYYEAGSGPVLLLVHGITSSADAWRSVMPALARHFTVVAPDLLGHGGSAKPRGDYSLGAYASGLRDLLAALGHERATVVGHSMGGGIAMVMAYQFPERVERLGAGLERRPRQGGRPRPARGDAAGRRARAAGDHAPRPARRGARRGAGAQPPRPAHARRRARHRARPRLAARARRPPRVHPHRALDHRLRRPARQRPRSPLPGGRDANFAAVGRPRPDDPRTPTGSPPTRRSPTAASRSSRAPGTTRSRKIRSAS